MEKDITQAEIIKGEATKKKYEKPEITILMPMETRTGSACPS